MKYKPLLNLKTKSVIPKAISSLYRFLGDLFKYPPHLPCRGQYNAWDSFGQVLHQPLHSGLLVVRMLSVFGLLVWLILLSSCTGTTVKEPCPPPPSASCPVCEQCPTCESSKEILVPDETRARVFISDLVVKEAKITRLGKPVKCENLDKVSDVALFLVYGYNITWKFPESFKSGGFEFNLSPNQQSPLKKDGVEIKLPPYNPQVTVVGEGDSREYQTTDKSLPEIEKHESSLTPNDDITQSRSSVKLILGPTCESTQLKIPYVKGGTKPDAVVGTSAIVSPKPGKFTLTLSVDGQQLSKEFVAQ
ncbi:MAG: hypothetical protein BWK78_03300 [Thiotrichaceae bacterium IS1]|nr:MAG: hypothetical protein BWK78_03300 [Thiotrichaceae bacterium IS1]